MDREGAAIRAESDHPLFAPTAVQTSPNILGSCREHPARICASVAFDLRTEDAESRLDKLETRLKSGLQEYIRRYGDKGAVKRSGAGSEHGAAVRLPRHYDLLPTPAGRGELQVYGLYGHMGALFENDNALIKAAYLLEALKSEAKTESSPICGPASLCLPPGRASWPGRTPITSRSLSMSFAPAP